jgi:N-acyl-D-amino-acid deacylase
MTIYDTIIAGGIVVDGRRNPRYRADVAIKDGLIADIGKLRASDADQVLDGEGMIVAPGFVDLHTHYDAQLFWDPYCSISGYHGVTSVVIGNCGFGFAPVRPDAREQAMQTLTRVEQIPYETMRQGLPWTWETFPEFLDALDRAPKGVNVLPYVPLNPVLHYVIGREESKKRHATPEENARIAQLFEEALEAGACGWSAQRTLPGTWASVQRDYDGTPFSTDLMSNETAIALAEVMGRRNEGFVQTTYVSPDMPADQRHMEELAAISGRPILWNGLAVDGANPDGHRPLVEWFDRCRERGLSLYCQGMTSDVSLTFTLAMWNMWDSSDAWRGALMGDTEERIKNLTAPGIRSDLRKDPPIMYPMDDIMLMETGQEQYQQYLELKLPEIAARMGTDMLGALLDISLADNLETKWWAQVFKPDDELTRELVQNPWVVPGVSDGGAHTKMITSGRFPTQHIETYVRENGWVSLEEMHWKLSALPAWVAGFQDRGTILRGAPADLIVYDYQNLRCLPDEIVHDLPGGEWRRVARAHGYRYIIVNGTVTFQEDRCTGATPGLLLRHGSARRT